MANETVQFVCMMFVDISAKSTSDEGAPSKPGGSLASLPPRVSSLIEHFGGDQIRALGTTVRCAFYDVKQAIACACALEAKMTPGCESEVAAGPSLRIGLHAGEATLKGDNFAGEVVMIAARLALIAEHHQVICTGTVFERADPDYQQSMAPLPKSAELEIRKDEVELYSLAWQEHTPDDLDELPGGGGDAESAQPRKKGKGPIRLSPKVARKAGSAGKAPLRKVKTGGQQPSSQDEEEQPAPAAVKPEPPAVQPATPAAPASEPPPPEPDVSLSLYSDQDLVAVLDASKRAVSLGRGENCDISLEVPTASRHHADVVLHNGAFYIIDHSINGTFVYDEEDQRIRVHHEQMELEDYGLISIGCSRTSEHAKPLEFLVDLGEDDDE